MLKTISAPSDALAGITQTIVDYGWDQAKTQKSVVTLDMPILYEGPGVLCHPCPGENAARPFTDGYKRAAPHQTVTNGVLRVLLPGQDRSDHTLHQQHVTEREVRIFDDKQAPPPPLFQRENAREGGDKAICAIASASYFAGRTRLTLARSEHHSLDQMRL